MSELRFRTPLRGEIPVEVYDHDLRLRGRVLTSQSLELEAGDYRVIARVPDGPQLRATVTVSTESSAVAELKRDRVRRPGTLALEATRHAAIARDVTYGEYFPDPTHRWIREGISPRGFWTIEGEPDVWHRPLVDRPPEVFSLRFLCPPALPQCTILPRESLGHLEWSVVEDIRGDLTFETRLKHGGARNLLAYLERGQVDGAELLAKSVASDAEQLLYEKGRDPVAAAAGALGLLAFGDLDRLHDWTKNLRRRFEWLPDGLITHAEHLARLGKHDAAVEALQELTNRALPILTLSLSTAVTRMRSYVTAGLGGSMLAAATEALTRYAVACDLTAAVTTFPAVDPSLPIARQPTKSEHQRGS